MKKQSRRAYRLTAIAAALLAAFGPAHAADAVTEVTKPSSSVQFGLGYVDTDAPRFGQYSGLNEQGGYGLLDADLVMGDGASGRWLRFRGRSLGLDSRELRFEHETLGNWGYYVDFSQTPRHEPYTVNTSVAGIGTPNLTVPGAVTPGPAVRLKTEREAIELGFNKYLPGNWDFKLSFRNEEKDGARIFARGTTGATGGLGNFNFIPEPINSTTRQLEATLNYTTERLQLSGGYYGTMYNNEYNGIFITNPGGPAALASFNTIALPPDNQSHQFHLSGGYNFTTTARGSFKLAYGKATQEDSFLTAAQIAPTPVQPGVPANLGGRVDTTLAQLGFTARPMPKLSVRASLRYEDRDDKTPLFRYGTGGATWDGNNEPRSTRTTGGKAEASYALPNAFRLTGGVDYEEKKRNTSPLRVVNFREKTDETSYRAELRRSMSDTVTGAIGYVHSERDGSSWITTTGVTPGGNVAPIHLADRERDQVRLTVGWQAAAPLNVQFRVDESRDKYTALSALGIGPRKGEASNYSVDAALTMTEKWQATAWLSRNETKLEQSQREGTSGTNNRLWAAALESVGDSLGLGLRGKPYAWLEVGGDLSLSDIKDEYRQEKTGGPGGAVSSLPDITTRLTRLQLFAKYAIQKNSGIRLDYVFDRFSTNDWTWTSFTYLDGTTITQDPVQKVHFFGASYYYRWQ